MSKHSVFMNTPQDGEIFPSFTALMESLRDVAKEKGHKVLEQSISVQDTNTPGFKVFKCAREGCDFFALGQALPGPGDSWKLLGYGKHFDFRPGATNTDLSHIDTQMLLELKMLERKLMTRLRNFEMILL